MIIDELVKARNGDMVAADRIIKRYERLIYFYMNEYEITNKEDCYDIVVERILKSFYKFSL